MLSVRNSVSSEKKPKQPSEAMKEITGSRGRDVSRGEDSAYESGGDARRLA